MFDTSHPSTYKYASTFEQQNLCPPRYVKTKAKTADDDNAPLSLPIPTNNWWGNIIHQQPRKYAPGPIEPVWSNPYAIRVVPGRGLVVTYSADHRNLGPLLDINPDVKASRFYLHSFLEDIVLSAVDLSPKTEVCDWDDFGVRVQLGETPTTSTSSAAMKSSLVSGMAFVSATYLDARPRIETQHAILSINGKTPNKNDPSGYTVQPGSKLVLEFNNGQFWVVFADKPIQFSFDNAPRNSLTATQVVDTATTVRVAKVDDATQLDSLDEYAGCVVLGGRVRTLDDKRYNLEWETAGDGPFLHYALEHHLAAFVDGPPENVSIFAQSSTRGRMHGISRSSSGDSNINNIRVWELAEPESVSIRFEPAQSIDPNHVREFRIDERLREEVAANWEIRNYGSYYFNGKTMQKYASLCLMAHDDVVNEDAETRRICLEKLAGLWDSFLSNYDKSKWPHPLVYDEIYGGIVSSQGFNTNDPNVDFGNTVYNDHHYHYGYWLVSAAILLHLYPDYPRRVELQNRVDVLVRDVANPNTDDPWFPRFRNFDWYLGHSYSHGVTPLADGKDQESVSEEINFHYGLMLWGEVTNRTDVRDLGELMLKANARTARTYFLMTPDNKIHPDRYIPNGVTGIFFDNKVDCTTWFSPERYCIHGIQMLPFSPITPLFRSQEFVRNEWDSILSRLPIVVDPRANQNPWQSILFANAARVVAPRTEAMKHLEYVPMDDGLSRAWALYMAATTL